MVLVDTCGWIEWLTGGKLSQAFEKYLKTPTELLIPTILQFELYKWICRERDEIMATNVIGVTEQGKVINIDTNVALTAADLAIQNKLAMADALIYACAQVHRVNLVTCDQHFQKLSDVIYLPKA